MATKLVNFTGPPGSGVRVRNSLAANEQMRPRLATLESNYEEWQGESGLFWEKKFILCDC